MKILLTIIISLFGTLTVFAKCTSKGLWVFPKGQTIKQNSIFVLDGYAESQKIILELNKKHNIYLKSGNKKIKLLVIEVCVGQFRMTQALLKPETELEAGIEYIMHIDDLPKYESFNRFNKLTHKYEPVTYKVLDEKDNEKPQFKAMPTELYKTLVSFGCGPSTHVVFSSPVKDSSDIIVKTTLKDLKTGKETTYYIQPDGDKIKVGHGMCSGAFDFEKNSNNFEVEFSFLDASGNLTPWIGERIKFSKPTKENKYENE
jgi:hypothetical protein